MEEGVSAENLRSVISRNAKKDMAAMMSTSNRPSAGNTGNSGMIEMIETLIDKGRAYVKTERCISGRAVLMSTENFRKNLLTIFAPASAISR